MRYTKNDCVEETFRSRKCIVPTKSFQTLKKKYCLDSGEGAICIVIYFCVMYDPPNYSLSAAMVIYYFSWFLGIRTLGVARLDSCAWGL